MTDSLTIFGTDFTGVAGIKATGTGNGTLTYIRPQGTKAIDANGTGIDVTSYASVDVSVAAPAPSLQAKTNINPSTSSQTIQADYGYDGLSSVQINAMPNGSVSASATKGSVSNHAISVTPTATVGTAGYLAAGSTNGTAVSVSASELVSGTYTVDSSGTHDVTNYASASVPASDTVGSLDNSYGMFFSTELGVRRWKLGAIAYTESAGWIEEGATSPNYQEYPAVASGTTVTPTTSSQTVGGSNYMMESAVTVNPIPSQYIVPTGNKEITSNGTGIDVAQYSTVSVNVSGGGGSDVAVDVVVGASTSTSISFSNLKGEPTSFSLMADTQIATGTPAKVAAVVFDGTDLHVQTITNTSNAQVSYVSSGFTKSYSNGTLTVSNSSASFAGDYYLVYTYDGGAGNISTADVQVGSGATSITFTGLEDEPLCWSCIFKSNFGTSSGYQRVIFVRYDGDITEGMEMDSSAKTALHWSASYNNGSLTITSNSTNQGGYFHQPGYYQLTYAVSGDQSMQTKTVTPTTSTQNVTADTGYTALKKVVVNPIPSSYVQPTSTVGATTYRASTSAQTIQSGTYHSAAATIAAVSQTNLSAENIKSGTTISISNGQSNLWSVTGSYTGSGGGGSANFGTATTTNSSNQAQSIDFTLPSGRTPKAFFARLTTQITRSSSSRYYYVENMRWDGSTTGGVAGRCFYMSSGQLTNITSGYSYSQSGTTFTLSSTGTRSASPGSFYNGTYELVYVY